MADKDKVVGKALYMELRNSDQTYQVIVTPDGIASNGKYVPASIYRRQISQAKPRRAWKTFTLPNLTVNEFGAFTQLDETLARSTGRDRVNYVESTFTRLMTYGYKLYKTPIIVEVSVEDLDGIRLSKTPYKILGRITRLRRTLNFGESLFAV